MRIRLTVNQVFIAAVVLALVVFYTVFRVYYNQSKQEKESAALVISTQDLMYHTEKISAIATAIETDSRAFLFTNQSQFITAYTKEKKDIPAEGNILKKLTADNNLQQLRLDSLLNYVKQRTAFYDSIFSKKKVADMPAALQMVTTGSEKLYLDNIHDLVSKMQQDEQVLLQKRKSDNAAETLKEQSIFIAIAFIMLVLLVALFWKERQSIQQKEIQKTRQQLEYLNLQINQANDAIYIVDAERKIKSWNRGAQNLYGFTRDEVLDKDPNTILQTGLSNEAIDLAVKEIAEKEYWTGELKRVRKDGLPIDVRSSTTIIRNSNGDITGYVAVSFDITAQKQLQEQLKEFEHFFNNSNDLSCIANTNGYFEIINPGFKKILGYSQSEMSENPFINFVHPDDIAATLNEYEKLKSGARVAHFFNRYRKKDGNYLWLDWNATPNPVTGKLYCIARDITDRKKAEEALNTLNAELEQKVKERTEKVFESEKRYRYLFENNPLPMWVIDMDTFKFLDVNEMAIIQYGYSREEFLSMTAKDIRPEEEIERFVNSDHSYGTGDINYNRGVWEHRKKNGTIIKVEIIAHEMIYDGVPAKFILSNDVTEKKQAEEKLIASEARFHRALDSMLEGVQIHDFNWRYIYVNDALVKYSTYTRDELIGYTVMEKYPGIEQSQLFKIMQRCMSNRVAEHLETEFVFPNGTQGYFELSLQPVPEGIFILSIDITERKLAEESIKKLNTELEERVHKRTEELKKVNEELEAFSYSVSHDLRAPLRAIIGFSAILQEDYSSKLDDEARRITAVIKDNTSKMGNLIDDLLTFSRMGRHEIIKSAVDSAKMVQEVVNGICNNGAGIIKWAIHPLPTVKADVSMIRQVWINLISNAVKYSQKSIAPEIQIGSFKHEGMVVFFVEDNGVGFDQKYKNKLFKVFQRLHSSEEFEGTGIGLAIVEKIVSKHGGHVWAEAELNKGASFYFSLPEN